MYQPITYNFLKSKGACVEQLMIFRKHFGVRKPIPLTKEVARKFGTVLDIGWASTYLLNSKDMNEYDRVTAPAWNRYQKIRDKADDEYNKVIDKADDEYEKVRNQALTEYEKVRNKALAEYKKVCAPSFAEYKKVCAIEFVRIYKRGLTSKKSQ